MKHNTGHDPWLICTRTRPDAGVRLFCLPFSGAGASFYRDWHEAMGSDIEVRAIQLPGRETRYREARITDADILVKNIVQALAPFQDKPFAIFGYSLGALLAFEVSRELRKQNLSMPRHLFLAAMRAPQTPGVHPPLSLLPDDMFLQQIEHYYQPQNEAWNIPELRELFLPLLRDDFVLAENYTYRDDELLSCPIDVFAGTGDRGAPPELTQHWSGQTTNTMEHHLYPGGHFFIDNAVKDIQKVILEKLSAVMV